ncbi:MAG: cell wall hydrolase [Phenylobacterium sp.]|uniref:cell wall hydrolase n=1 Tax=Phenylobacterium sp. TaxID=1871053 RepID=UPI0039196E2F
MATLIRPRVIGAATAALACAVAAWASASTYLGRGGGPARLDAALAGDLSGEGLTRLTGRMDPAMLSLAQRHDPDPKADFWGRPAGWATLDLEALPDLGFGAAPDATARQINALRPFAEVPIRPMAPFRMSLSDADGRRALQCLSEAVYYESAREPALGREAVAQVVLNRVRHPAYPKTVCGVVYQGSARTTGCQFSFTCDGSLRWAPEPRLWREAQAIAGRALSGYVAESVGSATHYHADYVAPYWAPTLVKLKQIGLHIFYRWTGPSGEPAAFTGRYAGGEAYISPAILGGSDPRTQGLFEPSAPALRQVTLAVGGETRTYAVAEAAADFPTPGALNASRRKPTPEEIRKINEALAALEAGEDAAARAATD